MDDIMCLCEKSANPKNEIWKRLIKMGYRKYGLNIIAFGLNITEIS